MYKSLELPLQEALLKLETQPSATITVDEHLAPKLQSLLYPLAKQGYNVTIRGNSLIISNPR